MNPLVLAALAFTAGVAVTVPVHVGLHRRWAGEHDCRRTWNNWMRGHELWDTADHNFRLARRWQGALVALQRTHKEIVGDLLDQLARQSRPRRPRYARFLSSYGRPA